MLNGMRLNEIYRRFVVVVVVFICSRMRMRHNLHTATMLIIWMTERTVNLASLLMRPDHREHFFPHNLQRNWFECAWVWLMVFVCVVSNAFSSILYVDGYSEQKKNSLAFLWCCFLLQLLVYVPIRNLLRIIILQYHHVDRRCAHHIKQNRLLCHCLMFIPQKIKSKNESSNIFSFTILESWK